jgi:uncharacterized protein (TIGR00290 family)
MKRTMALFSGGKDSFYSVQQVLRVGSLDLLVSLHSKNGDTQLHAGREATSEIRRVQLEGIGLSYTEIEVGEGSNYLHELFLGLRNIVEKERIGYLVTGDLWHPYTGGIGDMLAGSLNVELIRPAREKCPSKEHSFAYMQDVLDSNIRGVVTSVRRGDLSEAFVGREIDYEFLQELDSLGVDIVAEGGEYQSLVISAPIMDCQIIIDDFGVQLVDGKNGKEQFYRMNVKKFRTENG